MMLKSKGKSHFRAIYQCILRINFINDMYLRNPGRDMLVLFFKLLRQLNILFGQHDNLFGQLVRNILCRQLNILFALDKYVRTT